MDPLPTSHRDRRAPSDDFEPPIGGSPRFPAAGRTPLPAPDAPPTSIPGYLCDDGVCIATQGLRTVRKTETNDYTLNLMQPTIRFTLEWAYKNQTFQQAYPTMAQRDSMFARLRSTLERTGFRRCSHPVT